MWLTPCFLAEERAQQGHPARRHSWTLHVHLLGCSSQEPAGEGLRGCHMSHREQRGAVTCLGPHSLRPAEAPRLRSERRFLNCSKIEHDAIFVTLAIWKYTTQWHTHTHSIS